jgi:4-amino-4-deoxy-L-arabinose transferase-like glycosyltransferase
MYFVLFQVGVVSLYFLARRWVGDIAAFGTALLFSTQPLLVGHAFVNPKDTVLMSLMIADVLVGLRLMDHDEMPFRTTGQWFPDAIRSFFRQFLRLDVWLAGILLGFSSAVRIVALLIGLILLGYILVTRKWRMLPRLCAYGLIALAVMFLFWPYLWADPLGRLAEVLQNSAYYPDVHLTLFRGALVEASQTPRSYLPVLMPIQLTETTLLLILVGAYALLRKIRWDLVVLFAIWFMLPVLGIIAIRMNLYNNFRQLFFILPPLFLIAGLGLDWLLALVRRRTFQAVLLFLAVLPGLYANITLYPYQYLYYNQLTGGLRGAYREYELDYWNLAFREAQTYINQNAKENANIYAGDAKQTAQTFARPDLVFNALGGRKSDWDEYEYVIVTTAQNIDEQYDGLPTVFTIERDGVPLVYVKKPK